MYKRSNKKEYRIPQGITVGEKRIKIVQNSTHSTDEFDPNKNRIEYTDKPKEHSESKEYVYDLPEAIIQDKSISEEAHKIRIKSSENLDNLSLEEVLTKLYHSSEKESPFGASTQKYWAQRYRYFPDYDAGFLLDEEGLYSVCPAAISKSVMKYIKGVFKDQDSIVVADPMCGCGGMVLAAAASEKVEKVIACDIDPLRITIAYFNAKISGLEDKIQFIHCNSLELDTETLPKIDFVFTSPPWGSKFNRRVAFDPDLMPFGAKFYIKMCYRLSQNFGWLMPVDIMFKPLAIRMQQIDTELDQILYQVNILNGKPKTSMIFCGNKFK